MHSNYKLLDHTADTGMEVSGKTFPALLEQAATALFGIITDLEQVHPVASKTIELPETSPEDQLRSWLEELLRWFNAEEWLFTRFQVDNIHGELLGTAWGERYRPEKHTIYTEIKGITYHRFTVRQETQGWVATIIFDV
jgi:SHS2 domain-containing protein